MNIFLSQSEQRGILTVSEPKNDLKTYTLQSGSHVFSGYDRDTVVFHKRNYKIFPYKEIGQKMIVFYVDEFHNRTFGLHPTLSSNGIKAALSLFTIFDEVTGRKQPFLYKYGQEKALHIVQNFALLAYAKVLDTEYLIEEKNGQFFISGLGDFDNVFDPFGFHNCLSYLFVLSLLYGKFHINGSDLIGVKVQVPYFGQFTHHCSLIKEIVASLYESSSLFVDVYDNDGILELVINDYQILEQFALWYKPIETLTKIPKKDAAEREKNGLIHFLYEQGTNDLDLAFLKRSMIKPLVVG